MYVVFTRSIYPYYVSGYEPIDLNLWSYNDESSGGVSIISVSLSENKMVATVTLSGTPGAGDTITSGDFHTPSEVDGPVNLCLENPRSAFRDSNGIWTLVDPT